MTKEINISIIGHVDHGKSSLLAAMSNSFSKIGISPFIPYEQIDLATFNVGEGIKLNRAELRIATEKVNFIISDYPSHQDFIKNLIYGDRVDAILLVVSAADGPMPQTREHLSLAKKVGVDKVAILLNKVDMVSESLQEIVLKEVKDLLKEEGFDCTKCPTIKGSSLLSRKCGCGKRECPKCGFLFGLFDEMEKCFLSDESNYSEPLFVVKEFFSTPFGIPIVKGEIISGKIFKDSEISAFCDNEIKSFLIKGIEVNGQQVESASGRTLVNLYIDGIKSSDISNGLIFFEKGKNGLLKNFDALVYLFRKEEGGKANGIKNCEEVEVSFYGEKIMSKIKFNDREELLPGDSATASFELLFKSILRKGFSFTIIDNEKIIGVGKIVEIGE